MKPSGPVLDLDSSSTGPYEGHELAPCSEGLSPPVGLSLCDSAPLLWRVQDMRTVRSQGLVGALLGSLPRSPRQNGRLGRPLLLLPEEERLLRERRGAAASPAANQDGGGVEQYEEVQQRCYEEQSILALEDRKSALLQAMTSSGDPLRFHAHFIAICLSLDESICLPDVLAVARLGSNVKKTVLLCSPRMDGAVTYTSLQWSGMV